MDGPNLALIVKSPWIDLILNGEKTWELRGARTKVRGEIGLIKSGSGLVLGTCKITDCLGPFTVEQLAANMDRHRVPPERLNAIAYEHTYAWVIADAVPFPEPKPYRHPTGAVIWVRL